MLELPDVELVAVDTETSGLHPDGDKNNPGPHYVACVALAWAGGSIALPFDQGVRDKVKLAGADLMRAAQLSLMEPVADPNLGEAEWYQLLEWLGERRLIFHNAKFDLTFLETGTRHWPGQDLSGSLAWDTMLGQAVLEPIESKGLDATMQRLGREGKVSLEPIKQWLRRNKFKPNRYDLAPWSLVEPYVASDAEDTYWLFEHQYEQFATEAALEQFHREIALCKALFQIERRGVEWDRVGAAEAALTLTRTADEIEARMPFNCNPTEGRKFFYGEQGLRDEWGNQSLDEEIVRQWRKNEVPWAAEWAEVTRLRRAVSMWYAGYSKLCGEDGRLRTVYRQATVRSGRMSVERLQLQAVPKTRVMEGVTPVRELLHAREGFGLWNLDLSQAELRVASRYANCQLMLELLAAGEDLHGRTATEVLGAVPGDADWKAKRDIAKRLTFGGIFQIGGAKFAATIKTLADVDMPVAEAESLVRRWRGLYPEFGRKYRQAEQHAKQHGWVPLLPAIGDYDGELSVKSWFDFEGRGGGRPDWAHTAWNRVVQGSLAEFLKVWLREIERRWPGYCVLTVHDSVMIEAPEDEGDELAAMIARWAGSRATELFGIRMSVDVDRFDRPGAMDKTSKGDDQHEQMKKRRVA